MEVLPTDDPRAIAVVTAIHEGDVETLRRLLGDEPGLVTMAVGDDDSARSLLHLATDWPGHFPRSGDTVRVLVEAGADPNARFIGAHAETPLHWAASSDDVDALDALLDMGADIEARGAVIGDGTALFDATAFGQWNAARRLVERGAVANLWEASALGLLDRVDAHLGASPTAEEITEAFWGACHGGQLAAAQRLAAAGADINWLGWDGLTPLGAAERSEATDVVRWLRHQDE